MVLVSPGPGRGTRRCFLKWNKNASLGCGRNSMYKAQHIVMTLMITNAKYWLPARQWLSTLHILTCGTLTTTIGGRYCCYPLIVAMKYWGKAGILAQGVWPPSLWSNCGHHNCNLFCYMFGAKNHRNQMMLHCLWRYKECSWPPPSISYMDYRCVGRSYTADSIRKKPCRACIYSKRHLYSLPLPQCKTLLN